MGRAKHGYYWTQCECAECPSSLPVFVLSSGDLKICRVVQFSLNMPSNVLCGGGRWVLSHQARSPFRLVSLLRMFSATSPDEPYVSISHADSGPRTVWPDENMGPFGPQDQRFQLPGNVGFDCHLDGIEGRRKTPVHRTVPDILSAPSSTERLQFILAQFASEFQDKLGPVSTRVHKAEQYFPQPHTDCSISPCPELLKKDLELLFPLAPSAAVTVVTVTQRSLSEEAEQNNDQLLHRFVNGAKEMCFALWTAGYWADFIDPSTGQAFFASATGLNSLHSEGELRNSGFHIEASGACTVIRHILRGTSAFVGTVFTNAPTHSTAVTRLQGLTSDRDDEQ
ncbi:LOW QUALITY PROTEIN: metabolism of cobalamin associated Da [Neosynchiropus ocellatus]